MIKKMRQAQSYVEAISRSGLSIYDPIEVGSLLWIPIGKLEILLNGRLQGTSLQGLPLRTRSKVIKSKVCQALGYPMPKVFKRTKPRFPGQNFDTYVQKSNNLQIWNEEVSLTRRYVLIRVSEDDIVEQVKVINGETLASLDTTGTLTQKYQARLSIGVESKELITPNDTDNLQAIIRSGPYPSKIKRGPTEYPTAGNLLPIQEMYRRLSKLIGKSFFDAGSDQERIRGAELHRIVCRYLGYADFKDDGKFPDIRNQLLETKLQTSPTIDLGLVLPSSQEPLDIPQIQDRTIRHCDVRYAVFYAQTDGARVKLTHLFLTTGESFFRRFRQFQGNIINRKLQIPLPRNFFD